ncbi:MAG: flippase-like domain-containing protein [Calditrichaeota bacterium]|nr:flippase-like domain-containing protein [Calditrichota bacterium]
MSRRKFFYLKIVIGLALLGLISWMVDPQNILSALADVRVAFVAWAAALMPVNIALQEYKWRYLVRLVKPEVKAGQTLGSLLGGMTFGIVTPGRLGEYGRTLLIPDTPALKLVGLTVIDKFYNLGLTAALGLAALFTLPWAREFLGGGYAYKGTLIAIAALDLTLLYFALDPRPVRSLIYAVQLLLPKGDKVAQIAGGIDRFTSRQAVVVLLVTMLHYAVFLLQYFILLNGFTALNFIFSARGAAATLFLKSSLPIAIGDLGVDQIVAVQFFSQFNVPAEAAFNASLLLFALNVLIPALAGVIFVGRLPLTKSAESA